VTDIELTKLAAKAFGDAPDGFSPLTDDGDAFRLAVKLNISPMYGIPSVAVCAYSRGESYATNPYEATRRAIVRAAAEIGKGMK